MKLLQPLFLLLALFLPVIVLLHFRKKQVLEYRVSWLKFWDEAVREAEGIKNLKIHKYLLLALQLLTGALLVFSAAQPVWVRGFTGERAVVAIDCSISMKARENGETRFEEAKDKAGEYIKTLPSTTRVSILLLENGSKEYVKDVKKATALKLLDDISCTSESLDIGKAKSLLSVYPGEEAVFSDKDLSLGAKTVKVGNRLENLGITGASFDYYSRTLLCRVKNYCAASRDIGIEAADDSGNSDLQSVTVLPGTEESVSFNIKGNPGLVTVKITNEDMLGEDNSFVVPIGDEYKVKTLLLGDSPFLEKALSCIPDIKLETTQSLGEVQKEYDILIIAKKLDMVKLPQDCNIWNLCPAEEMDGNNGEEAVLLEPGNSSFARSLSMKEVYAAKTDYLKEKKGYTDILSAAGRPVMICGMEGGRRRVLSSLDFSRTNLVMLPDFPVLVHQTIRWLSADREKTFSGNPPPAFVTGAEGKGGKTAPKALPLMLYLRHLLIVAALLLMAAELEVYRHGL